MKTKKDLAKYLADYLEHEFDAKKEEYGFDIAVEFVFDNLINYINEGLEAFEFIENVQILENNKLHQELDDYKKGCEGLKLSLLDLRPYAEAYKRVCESLGIEKDILGYVKRLSERQKVVVTSVSGSVELKSAPKGVQVILHDYDIIDYEPDNPDRIYDRDSLGDYEVIEL